LSGDTVNRNINIVRFALCGVNLLMLLFLTTLVRVSTEHIVDRFHARAFLESLRKLPIPPAQVQFAVLACFAALVGLLFLQITRSAQGPVISTLYCLSEILLCIAIMYFLGFNYKGILFLPAVGIITQTGDDRRGRRSVFIAVVVILYILMDIDIISARYSFNLLSDYIMQYGSNVRFYLYGVRNILAGLGDMLFVLFMVLTIHQETQQAERFKDLYAQISRYAEELKIINLQLEEYSLQSEKSAQTRERNRMAREIHDVLGHSLTSISAAVDACISLIDRDPVRTKEQLIRIGDVARNGLQEVRRSVHALKPDALERFSLQTALRKMADDINELTNTRIRLDYPEDGISFSDEGKSLVYRIVQESITNSVRHGGAGAITIRARADGDFSAIYIQDNGAGCPNIVEGFGLGHIRDGVEAMGGQIQFSGQDGFETVVRLPVHKRS